MPTALPTPLDTMLDMSSHLPIPAPTERAAETLVSQFPLPDWPADLPSPNAVYGISEDGTDAPDVMLHVGARKTYLQAVESAAARDSFPAMRAQDNWYCDIDDDPEWSDLSQQTRDQVAAYARVLLTRYVESLAMTWKTTAGQQFLAAAINNL